MVYKCLQQLWFSENGYIKTSSDLSFTGQRSESALSVGVYR